MGSSGKVWKRPNYCPNGNRHLDSMNLKHAFVWNLGICHFGVKGEIQVTNLQELEYQYKIQRRITP